MAAEPGAEPAGPGPADPGQPAGVIPRVYYDLVTDAPAQVRVTAFRATLEILRPVLSQIWLDTTPSTGSWPPQVHARADVLAELIAAQPRPVARRPGTGPATLSLDPNDDASFDLALQLGPFAAGVSAMSRDGKLVCDTTTDRWRWRLTPIEHADLNQRLAAVAPGTWLVTAPEPQRPEAGPSWLLVIGALVSAPPLVRRGLDGLHHPRLDLDTVSAALELAAGAMIAGFAVAALAGAGRRLLARRRPFVRPHLPG